MDWRKQRVVKQANKTGSKNKGISLLRMVSSVVQKSGMDYFKDNRKEAAGSRDVVFENDVGNFVYGKEKQYRGTEHCTGRVERQLLETLRKLQPELFGR